MKFTTWMMISVAVVLAFSAHLVSAAAPRSAYDPAECPICEFGCQAIGGLLAQNFTTTEIVLALEMICALAPEPLATTCHQFLSNTLPVLFQAISSGKTAEQACELVGACPSSSAVIINLLSKTARINN
jgi:hypothetical protein